MTCLSLVAQWELAFREIESSVSSRHNLQSQLAIAQALLLLKGTVHFKIVKYTFLLSLLALLSVEVVFGLLDLAAVEMSAVFQICWSTTPLSLWQINTFEKTEKQPLCQKIMTRLIKIIHRACNELFHIETIFFLSAHRRKPKSTHGQEAHTCDSAGCNYQ